MANYENFFSENNPFDGIMLHKIILAFIPNFDLSQKVTVTKLVWYSFIELIQGNWEAYIYEPGQICWSRHSQLLSKGLIDVVLALMANSNLQQ